jgi:hypothetical protein
MSGYSLEMNTSQDGKLLMLMPIDCKNAFNDLQVQVCDEGTSIQKIRAVISEDGYYTEIEWEIMVSTWIEPQSENRFFSVVSSPSGIVGVIVLLIGLAGGGVLLGTRISQARELQEAFEEFAVSPERLAIRPEKKGVELPAAPDFTWSDGEN